MNCALSVFVLFPFTVGTMHRAPTYYTLLFSSRDTNLIPEFYLLYYILLLSNQLTKIFLSFDLMLLEILFLYPLVL